MRAANCRRVQHRVKCVKRLGVSHLLSGGFVAYVLNRSRDAMCVDLRPLALDGYGRRCGEPGRVTISFFAANGAR